MSDWSFYNSRRFLSCCVGLIIILVGFGLATGRSKSKVPVSPPLVAAQAAIPVAMPIPQRNAPIYQGNQAMIPVAARVQAGANTPAKPIVEGEWLGLEVAPITRFNAVKYGIPYGTQGLVVAEAEAQALTAGAKAGDVVLSINSVPIYNMNNFLTVTRNGALTKGSVGVIRKGQRLTINIGRPAIPVATAPAFPQQQAPVVVVNQTASPAFQRMDQLVADTPTPVTNLQNQKLPFQEAHWQGLETLPLTGGLRKVFKIPPEAKGVLVDDVTWPADLQGFQAGDLITSVGQIPTPTLENLIKAVDRVRDRRRVEVQLLRKGQSHILVLTAGQKRLGTANGETAPMIKAGSRAPHGYKGPCTQCHRIGATGQLAMDQGDILAKTAPPIRAGQTPPHRDRGECAVCHKIVR